MKIEERLEWKKQQIIKKLNALTDTDIKGEEEAYTHGFITGLNYCLDWIKFENKKEES